MTVQGGQEGVNRLREGLEAMQSYVTSASQHFGAAFEQTQAAAFPELAVAENVQSAAVKFYSLAAKRQYLLSVLRADVGAYIDRSGIAGLEAENGYAERAMQAARTYDMQDAGFEQFLQRFKGLVAAMEERLLASQAAVTAMEEACAPLLANGVHPVEEVSNNIGALLQRIDTYSGSR